MTPTPETVHFVVYEYEDEDVWRIYRGNDTYIVQTFDTFEEAKEYADDFRDYMDNIAMECQELDEPFTPQICEVVEVKRKVVY